MTLGSLISLEGSEGCGKSTQLEWLKAQVSLPDRLRVSLALKPQAGSLVKNRRHALQS